MAERKFCEWFAMCDSGPTTTIYHPILGHVPACQECSDKAERWRSKLEKPASNPLALDWLTIGP